MPNSLLHYGYSVYSQNDEDGIIQIIFKKIGKEKVNFIEFGVETNENNTSLLLLKGSRGVWIDKAITAFKRKYCQEPRSNLMILDEYVTKDNTHELIKKSLEFLQIDKQGLDFLSIDLDGNDYHILCEIINLGVNPSLICVEYNAKFPLPLEIIVKYNEIHFWKGDDYFGTSLQSYINLLKNSYTLLCCNSNGVNAFFIRNDLTKFFDIYNPHELYMKPRYFLSPYYKGHQSSTHFIEDILE
ncbi:MAG: hypothetical protein KKG99_05955 [Bacteroidetes bacterium]|nr:hypothetical protein [Bacteroidota bacterium]